MFKLRLVGHLSVPGALCAAIILSACGGDKDRATVVVTVTPPASATAPTTPSVSESPIASATGRLTFQGTHSSISLPDTFEGGDPDEDLPGLIERSRSLGDEFDQLADLAADQATERVDLVAFDFENRMTVLVMSEPTSSALSVENQMNLLRALLPKALRVGEEQNIFVGRYATGIFPAHLDSAGTSIVYFIQNRDSRIWFVLFGSPTEDYDAHFPMFLESVKSLTTPDD